MSKPRIAYIGVGLMGLPMTTRLVSLGYASWGEGQLESELMRNSWLTVDAEKAIIFDTPVNQRYERALDLLGLKAWMIAPQAGHA